VKVESSREMILTALARLSELLKARGSVTRSGQKRADALRVTDPRSASVLEFRGFKCEICFRRILSPINCSIR
jgi:hypothetical protein